MSIGHLGPSSVPTNIIKRLIFQSGLHKNRILWKGLVYSAKKKYSNLLHIKKVNEYFDKVPWNVKKIIQKMR